MSEVKDAALLEALSKEIGELNASIEAIQDLVAKGLTFELVRNSSVSGRIVGILGETEPGEFQEDEIVKVCEELRDSRLAEYATRLVEQTEEVLQGVVRVQNLRDAIDE